MREIPPLRSDDPKASTRRGLGRRGRAISGVLLAGVVGLALTAQAAHADDLTDRRDRVNQQIAQNRRDLSESSGKLTEAATALERSQADLEAARAQLAQTREDLSAATDLDAAMQLKLASAQKKLKAAKLAVVEGQRKLDAELAVVGEVVRQQYQQQTNLLGVSIMLAESQADVQTRMQWSTTMFDSTEGDMDRLRAAQRTLEAAKKKQAEIEKQVAADRAAAAANLAQKAQLEASATQQEATISGLVSANSRAARAAAAEVNADKQQYANLTSERASVERRIADRIARAKAAAAAKAAAERRAREAAAERRAAAAKAAKKTVAAAAKPGRSSSAPSRSVTKAAKKAVRQASSASRSVSSASFSYPVNAPITSRYGMRFHPVLHYWKLHDGTDFGAGCGAPIRAPYAGVVSERYYNAGYGNRLMIDHGRVGGRYITTGYNHAISYTVGVGQRVSKGEVIGYVGTTGYSTGCHLHLMVWQDGSMINPMSFF